MLSEFSGGNEEQIGNSLHENDYDKHIILIKKSLLSMFFGKLLR